MLYNASNVEINVRRVVDLEVQFGNLHLTLEQVVVADVARLTQSVRIQRPCGGGGVIFFELDQGFLRVRKRCVFKLSIGLGGRYLDKLQKP